jgi:predicted HTH transcriptional regulator
VILIGVADDGTVPGLPPNDVRRINQLIANAATQNIRSPISPKTENVKVGSGRVVIVLTVAEGLDKPYFDRQGIMWVKSGSYRRRIQSKEELRRLFQMTNQFHADEQSTKAGIDKLDKLRFRDFFDNRIEIISPGHLPNSLTVEKIRCGNSIIRNPILVSYVAKGLLPYHGLGSGIKRALEQWPQIDFSDDREGCLFTATVHRPSIKGVDIGSEKSSEKTEAQILGYLLEKTDMTIAELAEALGLSTRAVEKQIARLQKTGRLCRVGSKKAGRWQVLGVDK